MRPSDEERRRIFAFALELLEGFFPLAFGLMAVMFLAALAV